MKKIEWEWTRCYVCGDRYEYPRGGYKPATCNSFQCIHKHLHPELNNNKEVVK